MRVLHVIETLGRGGAEQSLLNLLPALREAGVEVELAYLFDRNELTADFEKKGIPLHGLKLTGRWSVLSGRRELGARMRHGNFDVVHSHLYFAVLYSLLNAGMRGPVMVASYHNLGYASFPANTLAKKLRKGLMKWLVRRRLDVGTGVSAAVVAHYQQHLAIPRMVTLPNAFPLDTLRRDPGLDVSAVLSEFQLPDHKYIVIVPGRLVIEKNHEVVLQALQGMNEVVHMVIVGHGPRASWLKAQLADPALKTRATLIEGLPHQDLLRLVQASDVFVSAARYEGFGLAPAEAMALEKPVVATAIGGHLDLIEHEVSGLLVPVDDAQALAAAVESLRQNPDRARALGAAACQSIRNRFSDTEIAGRLKELYQTMLDEKHGE